jgi:hypothetical protein
MDLGAIIGTAILAVYIKLMVKWVRAGWPKDDDGPSWVERHRWRDRD